MCIECKEIKPLEEFTRRTKSRDGRNYICKDCSRKRDANYRNKSENKNKISEKKKEWRNNNKARIAGTTRKWRRKNPDKYLPHVKRWNSIRKRNLGLIPLNKKFDGADGHHIDKQHVVYIPKELHMSIPHKQTDKESMEKINELTLNWMLGEEQ